MKLRRWERKMNIEIKSLTKEANKNMEMIKKILISMKKKRWTAPFRMKGLIALLIWFLDNMNQFEIRENE